MQDDNAKERFIQSLFISPSLTYTSIVLVIPPLLSRSYRLSKPSVVSFKSYYERSPTVSSLHTEKNSMDELLTTSTQTPLAINNGKQSGQNESNAASKLSHITRE